MKVGSWRIFLVPVKAQSSKPVGFSVEFFCFQVHGNEEEKYPFSSLRHWLGWSPLLTFFFPAQTGVGAEQGERERIRTVYPEKGFSLLFFCFINRSCSIRRGREGRPRTGPPSPVLRLPGVVPLLTLNCHRRLNHGVTELHYFKVFYFKYRTVLQFLP